MPISDAVSSKRQARVSERQEAELRPMALREAVEVGIADIEAGRYQTFETTDALREGLSAIVEDAIGPAASAKSRT